MKISGKFLKVLIPYKIYKLIANGFIVVPKYYKEILTETERYFDLSLEDHIYKDLMLMRKFGHIIDKGLHRTDASPGHSKNYYDALKQLVKKIKKRNMLMTLRYYGQKKSLLNMNNFRVILMNSNLSEAIFPRII